MGDELKRFNFVAATGDIEGAHDGLWCEYEPVRVMLSNAEFNAERDRARIRTLEAELAQAKADRDVLGAEVRAWRGDKEGDINAHAKIFVPYDDSRNFDAINQVGRWVKEAKIATDASGALSRAGGK